jgi:outer membrane immunogenic protein
MKGFVFVLAAAAAATPAYAQEPVQSPFTGARVEGRVGFDRAEVSVDDGTDDLSDGKSGVVYGGEAGFDFDLGNVVLGAYAGIEGSSVKACSELFGQDELCLKAGRNITVGGRVGVPLGSRSLLYAKGGYSNGKVKVTYEDFENIIDDVSDSQNLDGFHVGGGIETLFGERAYGKLEYVYTGYNSGDEGDDTISGDLNRHQVVAAVGIRF